MKNFWSALIRHCVIGIYVILMCLSVVANIYLACEYQALTVQRRALLGIIEDQGMEIDLRTELCKFGLKEE